MANYATIKTGALGQATSWVNEADYVFRVSIEKARFQSHTASQYACMRAIVKTVPYGSRVLFSDGSGTIVACSGYLEDEVPCLECGLNRDNCMRGSASPRHTYKPLPVIDPFMRLI